jgi:hypothetical protein
VEPLHWAHLPPAQYVHSLLSVSFLADLWNTEIKLLEAQDFAREERRAAAEANNGIIPSWRELIGDELADQLLEDNKAKKEKKERGIRLLNAANRADALSTGRKMQKMVRSLLVCVSLPALNTV